jgi:hypothetical protein
MGNKKIILLDYPYVSDFILETVKSNNIAVIKTKAAKQLANDFNLTFISEAEAIKQFKTNCRTLLYTNSENSIHWISKNLNFTDIPETINIFKDKVKFREITKTIFPNYFFKQLSLNELNKVDLTQLKFPLILKPAVGFFSLGVHKVHSKEEWGETVKRINSEIESIAKLYPKQVLDISQFIAEECIEGEEYAIDCYFNKHGETVILNILKHIFSSSSDVSDRVYLTSPLIIKDTTPLITTFLNQIGKLVNLKNFPLHVEVRIKNNKLMPIEINPLRFGGWCTTADFTYYSYGFNPYEYYFNGKKPNWNTILSNTANNIFSLIVLDNSTGIEGQSIKNFDYQGVLQLLNSPLHLRKTDYKKHPVFGFVFAKHKEENELKPILKSTLKEYITI